VHAEKFSGSQHPGVRAVAVHRRGMMHPGRRRATPHSPRSGSSFALRVKKATYVPYTHTSGFHQAIGSGRSRRVVDESKRYIDR